MECRLSCAAVFTLAGTQPAIQPAQPNAGIYQIRNGVDRDINHKVKISSKPWRGSSCTDRPFQGYCHPNLACPPGAPIAYMEVPKSACSSFKEMIVNELEINKTWVRHGNPKMTCCEGLNRLKIIAVRNPYHRYVSFFSDKIVGRDKADKLNPKIEKNPIGANWIYTDPAQAPKGKAQQCCLD